MRNAGVSSAYSTSCGGMLSPSSSVNGRSRRSIATAEPERLLDADDLHAVLLADHHQVAAERAAFDPNRVALLRRRIGVADPFGEQPLRPAGERDEIDARLPFARIGDRRCDLARAIALGIEALLRLGAQVVGA